MITQKKKLGRKSEQEKLGVEIQARRSSTSNQNQQQLGTDIFELPLDDQQMKQLKEKQRRKRIQQQLGTDIFDLPLDDQQMKQLKEKQRRKRIQQQLGKIQQLGEEIFDLPLDDQQIRQGSKIKTYPNKKTKVIPKVTPGYLKPTIASELSKKVPILKKGHKSKNTKP